MTGAGRQDVAGYKGLPVMQTEAAPQMMGGSVVEVALSRLCWYAAHQEAH
jgi:hypothetical protein